MYDQVETGKYCRDDLQFDAPVVRPDPQQRGTTSGRHRLGRLNGRDRVTGVCSADAVATTGLGPPHLHRLIVGPIKRRGNQSRSHRPSQDTAGLRPQLGSRRVASRSPCEPAEVCVAVDVRDIDAAAGRTVSSPDRRAGRGGQSTLCLFRRPIVRRGTLNRWAIWRSAPGRSERSSGAAWSKPDAMSHRLPVARISRRLQTHGLRLELPASTQIVHTMAVGHPRQIDWRTNCRRRVKTDPLVPGEC